MTRSANRRPSPARRTVPLSASALALALAATLAATHPAQAAAPEPTVPAGQATDRMPVPKASRDGRPVPVKDVLKSCKGAGCDFRIAQGPVEYLSAVTNVGSAIVNCSDADMKVEREVTLTSSVTDNVEGEISGSWTHEGTVDKTVWGEDHAEHTESARLQNTGTTTVTGTTTDTETKRDQTSTNKGTVDHSAPKDKGPNTETHNFNGTQNETTTQKQIQGQTENSTETQTEVTSSSMGSVTGHDELHVGVKEAFTAAFRLTAGRELTQSVQERMMYTITLKPKDILTLGAQNAMVRTQGTLRVNDSAGAAKVENITVNSPSTTNASSLIAQTYTDAGQCVGVRPSKNAADPQPGPRPGAADPQPGARPGAADPQPGPRPGATDPQSGARTGAADAQPGPEKHGAPEAPRPVEAAPGLYEVPAPSAEASPQSKRVIPLPDGTKASP
ncbi:hypothetical protein [Streptomyces sp. G45]|uniref:hypothetical protein n=1 Tax=Streptomyces sp. G45 TaxID=3406627 RepID=UPI003C28CB9F